MLLAVGAFVVELLLQKLQLVGQAVGLVPQSFVNDTETLVVVFNEVATAAVLDRRLSTAYEQDAQNRNSYQLLHTHHLDAQ